MTYPFTITRTVAGTQPHKLGDAEMMANVLNDAADAAFHGLASDANEFQRQRVAQLYMLTAAAWKLAQSGVLGHARMDRYCDAEDRCHAAVRSLI